MRQHCASPRSSPCATLRRDIQTRPLLLRATLGTKQRARSDSQGTQHRSREGRDKAGRAVLSCCRAVALSSAAAASSCAFSCASAASSASAASCARRGRAASHRHRAGAGACRHALNPGTRCGALEGRVPQSARTEAPGQGRIQIPHAVPVGRRAGRRRAQRACSSSSRRRASAAALSASISATVSISRICDTPMRASAQRPPYGQSWAPRQRVRNTRMKWLNIEGATSAGRPCGTRLELGLHQCLLVAQPLLQRAEPRIRRDLRAVTGGSRGAHARHSHQPSTISHHPSAICHLLSAAAHTPQAQRCATPARGAARQCRGACLPSGSARCRSTHFLGCSAAEGFSAAARLDRLLGVAIAVDVVVAAGGREHAADTLSVRTVMPELRRNLHCQNAAALLHFGGDGNACML